MSDIRLLQTIYFSLFTSYFVWHPRQSAIYPDESHMKIFKSFLPTLEMEMGRNGKQFSSISS
jgi:hypothetical protein